MSLNMAESLYSKPFPNCRKLLFPPKRASSARVIHLFITASSWTHTSILGVNIVIRMTVLFVCQLSSLPLLTYLPLVSNNKSSFHNAQPVSVLTSQRYRNSAAIEYPPSSSLHPFETYRSPLSYQFKSSIKPSSLSWQCGSGSYP